MRALVGKAGVIGLEPVSSRRMIESTCPSIRRARSSVNWVLIKYLIGMRMPRVHLILTQRNLTTFLQRQIRFITEKAGSVGPTGWGKIKKKQKFNSENYGKIKISKIGDSFMFDLNKISYAPRDGLRHRQPGLDHPFGTVLAPRPLYKKHQFTQLSHSGRRSPRPFGISYPAWRQSRYFPGYSPQI